MVKNKGLVIALSMITVLFLGIATGLFIENKTPVVNTLFSSNNNGTGTEKEETITDENIESLSTSYTLKLPNDKQIKVPASWQVTEVTVNVLQLDARIPQEQGISFFAPLCKQSEDGCDVEGIYPIHDKSVVRLSNGESELYIEERSLHVVGPIGFQCDILEKDISEYTIVFESKGEDHVGLVRSESAGNWTYTPYRFTETDMCLGTVGQPNYIMATIGLETYVFNGNSEDIAVADGLMIDYLDLE
ncbi:hypothetical protein JW962_01255 [Candidatus Dojkabacteria bacterium]|nr:hypothetical protein [Candidatus Dojkabacteria bacterium]